VTYNPTFNPTRPAADLPSQVNASRGQPSRPHANVVGETNISGARPVPHTPDQRKQSKRPNLSPDEQAFVDAYAENGGDALQAYEATKPNPHLSHKAKAQLAGMMLRREKVKRAIAPLHDAAARAVSATLERYAVNKATIAAALARLAFSDIRDVVSLEHMPVLTKSGDPVLDRDKRPVMRQVLALKDFSSLSASAAYAIASAYQNERGMLRVTMCDKLAALRQLVALSGLAGPGGISEGAGDVIEGTKSTGPAPVYLTVTRAAASMPQASPVLATAARVNRR
jgi:hypothetical protein